MPFLRPPGLAFVRSDAESHKCASNRPVHRCFVTPRNLLLLPGGVTPGGLFDRGGGGSARFGFGLSFGFGFGFGGGFSSGPPKPPDETSPRVASPGGSAAVWADAAAAGSARAPLASRECTAALAALPNFLPPAPAPPPPSDASSFFADIDASSVSVFATESTRVIATPSSQVSRPPNVVG